MYGLALLAVLLLAQLPPSQTEGLRQQIERSYESATRNPSEPNLFDLGTALTSAAQYAESAKFFQFGIGKFPKSARLRVGLGVAFHGMGEYDKAVESLCAGVDLDPKDTRALYFLGKMYDLSPAMAREVTARLRRFVETYPGNAAANLYYGLSYWKSRNGAESTADLEVAARHLTRAVALDPKSAEAHFQLGALRERQRREPEAIREFEAASRLDPQNASAWYRLGQALSRRGEKSRAEKAFAKYRTLQAKTN